MTTDIHQALLRGETIELDGLQLRLNAGKQHGSALQPGDMYIDRRAGARLLTVATVDPDREAHHGHVQAVQGGYRSGLDSSLGVEVVGITSAFEVHEQLDL